MQNTIPDLGDFIKQKRLEARITQKELATKCGVTIPAVSKWENGKTIPNVETLLKVAQVLNIPFEAFYDPYYDRDKKLLGFSEFWDNLEEKELLRLFRELPPLARGFLMDFAAMLINYEKNR